MRESGTNTVALPREEWDDWDPTLISEGLFAAANIFSSLKLVYIFSVNPYLGPLQVAWWCKHCGGLYICVARSPSAEW